MADKPQDKEGPESFFADWMKTTSALWGSMASMWTEAARAPEKTETSKDSGMSRVQESWEIALKTWQTFATAMSRPDYMATHLQGINALPSILLNVAQKSWDGYSGIKKAALLNSLFLIFHYLTALLKIK